MIRPIRHAAAAAALLASHAAAAQPAGGFKHIIIVVQENRTPDNLFGSNPKFEPGVDIASSGVNSKGATIALTAVPLAGCYDIAHTHAAFEAALTAGFDTEPYTLDKCPAVPANAQFKYVDNSAGVVQPYFDLAENFGFANRMFQTNQGPSFPAHQFLFGGTSAPQASTTLFSAENLAVTGNAGCIAPTGQTVALIDGNGSETTHAPTFPCYDHQTLADLLDAAKPPVSWRYYAPSAGAIWTAPNAISHICKPALVKGALQCTGADWTKNVVSDNPAQVLTDIAACKLAGVSWVIPTGLESDHANANNGTGPQWVASIVNAVGTQSCPAETYWDDTLILITWDDWGGWYDHVPPFDINVGTATWGSGYTYGFRVPLLVVSAYTEARTVSNHIYDFGSLLRFVERNFGLGTIGPGTTRFNHYADYFANYKPFGKLTEFFTLSSPKDFTPIPTVLKAWDFIHAPRPLTPPDDD
jgi:phospholipase C